MKTMFAALLAIVIFMSCENRRSDDGSTSRGPGAETEKVDDETTRERDNNPITGNRDERNRNADRNYDENITNDNAEERIDRSLAMAGRSIFMSECASCHRVTDDESLNRTEEKKELSGPELTQITDRRNDRWLVKFMTNSDGEEKNTSRKDPEDICMVQKKGKELNRDQALKVLEYLHMRNQSADQR